MTKTLITCDNPQFQYHLTKTQVRIMRRIWKDQKVEQEHPDYAVGYKTGAVRGDILKWTKETHDDYWAMWKSLEPYTQEILGGSYIRLNPLGIFLLQLIDKQVEVSIES